jgi:hypothetical protein
MKLYLPILLLGLALLLPQNATAQDDRQLFLLTEYTVDARQMGEFQTQVHQVAEAARQANLAQEHGWFAYADGNRWAIVQPIASFAQLDDTGAMVRAFQGTPGEAMLQAAMAALNQLDVTGESRIIESRSGWRYQPQGAAPTRYVVVFENTLGPGAYQEFGAVMRDLVTGAGQINYPFAFEGYAPRIGTDTYPLVFWVDDLSQFLDQYTGGPVAQRHPEVAPVLNRLFGMVRDQEMRILAVQQDHSYWP